MGGWPARALFLSWAHADQADVDALMSRLEPELKSLADVSVSVWADSIIPLGDEWRQQIMDGLDRCDYALALISPNYLTRPFIVEQEIPRLVGTDPVTRVLPVGLRPVALDGSRQLHGLEAHQMHLRRARNGRDRFFSELDRRGKDAFAADLATRIRARLLRDAGTQRPLLSRPTADHAAARVPSRKDLPGPLARAAVLLVGCSEFPLDPISLPALPSVTRNLDALAELLCDPELGGADRGAVTIVRDPQVPDDVMIPLSQLACRDVDVLLVYYAGHGILRDGLRLGLGKTTCAGARWNGLEAKALRDEVANSTAAARVLIADCCFSGDLVGRMSDAASLIEAQLHVDGAATLASSAWDVESLAPPDEPLTAFTGELAEALRGGIPGEGELLQLHAVFRHVRSRLLARGRPEPRFLTTGTAAHAAIACNRAR